MDIPIYMALGLWGAGYYLSKNKKSTKDAKDSSSCSPCDKEKEMQFKPAIMPSNFESHPMQFENVPPLKQPFVHNNMVPFYRGVVKQNTKPDNRLAENKLEVYTGNFKLDAPAKRETTPFFTPAPQPEAVRSLDAPRQLDRYQRNLGYRNHEVPFKRVKVGPGLNKKYGCAPKGGHHDLVRILPKTIDQLMVNPKRTYKGRIKAGKHPINKPTVIGKVHQYKPAVLVDNEHGQRNFTTTGAYIKPRHREKVILRPNVRHNQYGEVRGPAKIAGIGGLSTPDHLKPKVKEPFKQTGFNTPYRNAVQSNGKKNIIGAVSYENRYTQRASTGVDYSAKGHHMTNPKSNYIKPVASLMDEARKTLKEDLIHPQNPYGHANPHQRKHRTYDPDDVAKPTHRQSMTDNPNQAGYVQSSHQKHQVYDPDDVMRATQRQTMTDNPNQAGYVQSSHQKHQVYDPIEYAPRGTNRQFTGDTNYIGIVGANHANKHESREAVLNMRQNTIREHISKGRTPTQVGSKRAPIKELVNIQVKKLDSDRVNRYPGAPSPTYPKASKPIFTGEVTRFKNAPPSENPFFDTSIVEPLKCNPLSIPLNSIA